MFTDAIESYGLTLFITEAVKLAAGRDRPFTEKCDAFPPRDAGCGSEDRHRSFFSGHTSLAAAGAGLTCSFALRRDAWGTSRTAHVAQGATWASPPASSILYSGKAMAFPIQPVAAPLCQMLFALPSPAPPL